MTSTRRHPAGARGGTQRDRPGAGAKPKRASPPERAPEVFAPPLDPGARSLPGPALIIADPMGRFVYACPAAGGIFGVPAAELVGRTWTDPAWRLESVGQERSPGRSRPPPELTALVAGKVLQGVRLGIERSDGTRSILSIKSSPVRDADGKEAATAISVADVTALAKAEQELRGEAERHRRALAANPVLSVELDARGRVNACNDALLDLAGRRRAEVVGKDWFDLFLPVETRADQRLWFERCMAAGEMGGSFESGIRTAAGRDRQVRWTTTLLGNGGGRPSGAALNGQDITDRLRLQEDLLRARHMQSVGVVAGGIANEFNNILTAILGNLSLAKVEAEPQGDLARTLDYVERAALRARGLTERLLAYAKGGAPVGSATAIDALAREVAAVCVRGPLHVCEVETTASVGLVEVDPEQMRLVLTNLLLNAMEAAPDGGTIRVRVERTTAADRLRLPMRPGAYVRLSVSDDGPAIPRGTLETIFEPVLGGKESGAGLGLATTYFVVRAHGGYVDVDSCPGRGNQRSIYLPAMASGTDAAREAAPEARLRRGSGKVLVVDDDEMVCSVAGRMLRHLGYEVGFATDAEQAVREYAGARAAGGPYDLVIMDLKLAGGVSGTEAMSRLRSVDPKVRAVISSGYADDEALTRYSRHGFLGAVRKPYQLADLGRVVEDALKS